MPETPEQQQKMAQLIELLVEQKIISSAQAQLAQNDQKSTGMTLDEVLIARRWVKEETLFQLAPWLRKESSDASKMEVPPLGSRAAQEALKAQEKGAANATANSGAPGKTAAPAGATTGSTESRAGDGQKVGGDGFGAPSIPPETVSTEPGNFQENLEKYYDLLNQILDDA